MPLISELVVGSVQFLTALNLMDYSLLVGIHDSRLADAAAASAPCPSVGGDPFDSEDNGLDDDESETEPNEFGGGVAWGSEGAYGSSPPAYSPRRSAGDRFPSVGAQGVGAQEGGTQGGGASSLKIDRSVEVYAIKSGQREWAR